MSLPNAERDEDIDKLWAEATTQIIGIDPVTENWKAQVLPLARIKKIMKSEEAIFTELETEQGAAAAAGCSAQRFMIAGEAPVLLEKACELLVRELTVRAWRHTERCRRRTLQRQDVHAAVGENEVYDFLIDIVPRVTPLGSTKTTYTTVPTAHIPTAHPAQAAAAAGLNFGHTLVNPTNVTSPAPKDSGMSLADAELRLAQLQQMQEQFLMMQQRMQAEAGGQSGSGDGGTQQTPQMQQMSMHPAMFLQGQATSAGQQSGNNGGQNDNGN